MEGEINRILFEMTYIFSTLRWIFDCTHEEGVTPCHAGNYM